MAIWKAVWEEAKRPLLVTLVALILCALSSIVYFTGLFESRALEQIIELLIVFSIISLVLLVPYLLIVLIAHTKQANLAWAIPSLILLGSFFAPFYICETGGCGMMGIVVALMFWIPGGAMGAAFLFLTYTLLKSQKSRKS